MSAEADHDRARASTHSYLGSTTELRSSAALRPGEVVDLPYIVQQGCCLLPGQTLPLLLHSSGRADEDQHRCSSLWRLATCCWSQSCVQPPYAHTARMPARHSYVSLALVTTGVLRRASKLLTMRMHAAHVKVQRYQPDLGTSARRQALRCALRDRSKALVACAVSLETTHDPHMAHASPHVCIAEVRSVSCYQHADADSESVPDSVVLKGRYRCGARRLRDAHTCKARQLVCTGNRA